VPWLSTLFKSLNLVPWLAATTNLPTGSGWLSYYLVTGLPTTFSLAPILANMAALGSRLNPYQPGYAEYLRFTKGKQNLLSAISYLANCLDLPADVKIELMDRLRAKSQAAQDPAFLEFIKTLEFPLDRMGRITLDSLAAARRVAQWLGDDKALREIDRRIVQDAPALQS
jgi:hypothetical protein